MGLWSFTAFAGWWDWFYATLFLGGFLFGVGLYNYTAIVLWCVLRIACRVVLLSQSSQSLGQLLEKLEWTIHLRERKFTQLHLPWFNGQEIATTRQVSNIVIRGKCIYVTYLYFFFSSLESILSLCLVEWYTKWLIGLHSGLWKVVHNESITVSLT